MSLTRSIEVVHSNYGIIRGIRCQNVLYLLAHFRKTLTVIILNGVYFVTATNLTVLKIFLHVSR